VQAIWHFSTAPLRVQRVECPELPRGSVGYPTFRKARMALIEALQKQVRMHQQLVEYNKAQVDLVAHMEEPS
jgi:hypothetical protein